MTLPALAPLTVRRLMRQPLIPIEKWHLDFHTRPFLKPIRHPLDVRPLIQRKSAELVAGLAPLVIHRGVVPVASVSSYLDGHFLAGPGLSVTGWVGACESAHDVGAILVVEAVVRGVFVEPWRGDFGGNGVCDAWMEGGEGEELSCLLQGFGSGWLWMGRDLG